MGRRKLKELQERIGYRFQREELLHQALSHSSYVNEHRQEAGGDNERLEFLGDAVLELSSSEFLYLEYPEMPEGDMTKLRASLVCEPTLAMCAREMNLPDYLLLGKERSIPADVFGIPLYRTPWKLCLALSIWMVVLLAQKNL